jgi:methyl-accepting chemotaxis protein
MKNLSLNAKLSFIIGLFVIACTTISVKAISDMKEINRTFEFVTSVLNKRVANAYEIRGFLRLMIIEEKNLITLKQMEQKRESAKKIQELYSKVNGILEAWLPIASEFAKPKLEKLRDKANEWMENNKKIQEHSLKGDDGAATDLSLKVGRQIRIETEKLGAEIVDFNKKKVDESVQQANDLYNNSRNTMILVSLMATLIGLGIATVVLMAVSKAINTIISSLDDNSIQLTSSAQQIASSSEQLSQAATEQASSLEETASSVEQMNSTVQKNAENAKKSADISSTSQNSALKGKQVVQDMIRAIEEINSSNNDIMQQINESNQQISEIVKVISEIGNKTKVINDIVFQTKLLSFNASVEAARAGEHGKGFAVVAEEVGNLAQMSGNAAKEIAQMLDGSIQKVDGIVNDTKTRVERLVAQGKEKVNAGTRVAQECGEVLDDIVKNVTNVSQIVGDISSACQEQAQGVQEITKAMSQLDQVTQENAATSEEAASAAEELSSQADSLKGVIQLLIQTIKGQSHHQSQAEVQAAKAGLKTSIKTVKSASTTHKEEPSKVVHLKNRLTRQADGKEGKDVALKKAVGADYGVPSEHDARFKDI